MIDAQYVLCMARYNAWQNRQYRAIFEAKGEPWLRRTGSGFFGSIFATANHLLWGDAMWMARFEGKPLPRVSLEGSPDFTAGLGEWSIARFRMDARILHWAENLRSTELVGEMSWYSGALGRDVRKPRDVLVAHMFNHQSHHRGQIHAMLTAAGEEAPVSDLFVMPESGPWL